MSRVAPKGRRWTKKQGRRLDVKKYVLGRFSDCACVLHVVRKVNVIFGSLFGFGNFHDSGMLFMLPLAVVRA